MVDGFRTRLDELETLTSLHKELDDKTWNENGYSSNPAEARAIVIKFLVIQIEELVTPVMDHTLKTKNFDYEFTEKVCDFDQELFKKIFQNIIINNYPTIGLDEILQTVNRFKRFLPAIIGYESIFNVINSGHNKEEFLKLANQVQRMRSMRTYSQLPLDLKERVESLANRLLPDSE